MQSRFALTCLAATLLLAGCPGGGGSSRLGLASVTPADGAGDQSVDPLTLAISAIFDQALDPATAGAGALRLTGPSGEVAGAVALSGDRTLVFTPAAPLALAADHTVTVADSVRGASGERPRSGTSWTFGTRDGQWQNAALAEDDDTAGQLTNVRLAVGSGGHAVVSWSVFPAMTAVTDVLINHFDPQTGWQGAASPSRNIASATFPSMQLAIDGDGSALGVWGERSSPPGGPSSFFATTFAAGVGTWSLAAELDDQANGTADQVAVAFGPGGTFWALYGLNKGATMEVYVNVYTPGSGWGGPVELENTDWDAADTFLSGLRIAVDDNGNAVAAWSRHTDTDNNMSIDQQDDESVFARYYDAGMDSWAPARQLSVASGNDASVQAVAVDPTGGFLVLWSQFNASFESAAYAAFYRAGWQAAEVVWPHAAALFPDRRLRFDAMGNAIVLGSGDETIFAAEYRSGSGWQALATIEGDPATELNIADFAMNANGDAVVMWRLQDGDDDLLVRHFDPVARTWSAAENIDVPDAGEVRNGARIALDAAGNAIAAWHADGTEMNAFAARYRAGSGWSAPQPLESASEDTDDISMGLGVDARGNAIAAWAQGPNNDEDVYFIRFE